MYYFKKKSVNHNAYRSKIEMNNEFLKNSLNCCKVYFIEPVQDGTGKCQDTVHTRSTDLLRIQLVTWYGKILNFETSICVLTAVIMEPSIWYIIALPFKATYGLLAKCLCPKTYFVLPALGILYWYPSFTDENLFL
jgi:hypothetical protein